MATKTHLPSEINKYWDNYGKGTGTSTTQRLVTEAVTNFNDFSQNLKRLLDEFNGQSTSATSAIKQDTEKILGIVDGTVTTAHDLDKVLRKIAEEFVTLRTEREMLYLRSELVSTIDRWIGRQFPQRGAESRQVGVDRLTLPAFLDGEMTLLRTRKGLAINANTKAGALRLAQEFLDFGSEWLEEECDPKRFASDSDGDSQKESVNKEFLKLREKLFDARRRRRKLNDKQKKEVLEDVLSLQQVLKQRFGDEADLFFDSFEVKDADRISMLQFRDAATNAFGEYQTFLRRCAATKTERNGVAHANAYRRLTYDQLRCVFVSDSDTIQLLELVHLITNSDSDQPLLYGLDERRLDADSDADADDADSSKVPRLLMSREDRIEELLRRWKTE